MQDELIEMLMELPKLYFDCLRHKQSGDDHAHPRQGPILCLLLSMDGISQADLVRKLGVSAATVAVSITRLERLGYVERARNMHNQRANILRLTEQGRAEAERMHSAMHELCQIALNGLTGEECEQMRCIGERMKENLRQAYEKTGQSDH